MTLGITRSPAAIFSRSRALLAAVTCLLVLPARAQEATLSSMRTALDNGLEMLVHQDPRLPLVCVSVWYHAGALQEPPGQSGVAHLLERLMFHGSEHAPGDSHIKLLEAAGASFIDGAAGLDSTRYAECVPHNELELALWLESDRMAWLMKGVDAAALAEVRAALHNEREQALVNRPYAAADEQLWQAMFPAGHPYRDHGIGNAADLDKLSVWNVKQFYDAHYAPANATVTIAGDVDSAEAKRLVEKYFGTLPSGPRPPKRDVPPPVVGTEVRLDVEDERAQLTKVVLAYFTPAAFQQHNAELDVLAHVLGTGNGARLHQALVVDSQLAQEVAATQQSFGNVAILSMSAVVKPGADAEDVLNAMQAQVELLRDLPPSEEEIGLAVTAVEAKSVFDLQRTLARAEQLQRYNHFVGEPGFLAKDLARYRAVTPETVQAAVTAHLVKERRAVLVARPKGSAPPAPAAGGAS